MSAIWTWGANAGGLIALLAISYFVSTFFIRQIRIGRRMKLAVGVRGEARRRVSMAESTAGVRSNLSSAFAALGGFMPLGDEDRAKLAVNLQRAGFHSSNALGVMFGVKFVCIGAGLLLGFSVAFSTLSGLLLVFGAGLVGGLLTGVLLNILPEMVVQRLAKRRMWRMANGLTDTFDLMVICLESGLTFDRALDRTVDNLGSLHPDLAKEFAQVLMDVNVHGRSRGEALRRLADRLDNQNFRDLAMTVDQSERHGTPLADALRKLGSSLRVEAVARVQEKMARLPTLLVVPSIGGILPGILVIVGGPAFLQLMDSLGSVGG